MAFRIIFPSHVSHELRSPLTALLQFSSILVSGLGGALNDGCGATRPSCSRRCMPWKVHALHTMIDDLREVSRIKAAKLSIDSLAMTAGNKGVGLSPVAWERSQVTSGRVQCVEIVGAQRGGPASRRTA